MVGLAGLSACPNNTPGDPILDKVIVGEWDVGGSPAYFNSDGTCEIEYYSLAGTNEVISNVILVTLSGGLEPTHTLLFHGFSNGNPVLSGPLSETTLNPSAK